MNITSNYSANELRKIEEQIKEVRIEQRSEVDQIFEEIFSVNPVLKAIKVIFKEDAVGNAKIEDILFLNIDNWISQRSYAFMFLEYYDMTKEMGRGDETELIFERPEFL